MLYFCELRRQGHFMWRTVLFNNSLKMILNIPDSVIFYSILVVAIVESLVSKLLWVLRDFWHLLFSDNFTLSATQGNWTEKKIHYGQKWQNEISAVSSENQILSEQQFLLQISKTRQMQKLSAVVAVIKASVELFTAKWAKQVCWVLLSWVEKGACGWNKFFSRWGWGVGGRGFW